jgi:hypothetical protein
MAIDRADARRPVDGGGGHPHPAQRVLHGRDRRRRVEDRELRHQLGAGVGWTDPDRIDWRDRRRRCKPEHRLCRHRQRGDSLECDYRPGRVQVDRRRQDVAVRRPQGGRADRPAEGPSEKSRHRLRRSHRAAVWLGPRPRRLSHEGRRQDVAEGSVHQRPDRRRVGGDQLAESQRDLRRRLARTAQAVDDHQRRPGCGGRRLQVDRRRRSLVAREQRAAGGSDRQGVGRRRAIEPQSRLRAGGSERR